jgi:hypothetical protein
VTSTNVTMRQNRIPTSNDERLGPTVTREGRQGFTGGLLDKGRLGVFTAPYISQTDMSVKHSEEAAMKQDDKTGTVTATIQEICSAPLKTRQSGLPNLVQHESRDEGDSQLFESESGPSISSARNLTCAEPSR